MSQPQPSLEADNVDQVAKNTSRSLIERARFWLRSDFDNLGELPTDIENPSILIGNILSRTEEGRRAMRKLLKIEQIKHQDIQLSFLQKIKLRLSGPQRDVVSGAVVDKADAQMIGLEDQRVLAEAVEILEKEIQDVARIQAVLGSERVGGVDEKDDERGDHPDLGNLIVSFTKGLGLFKAPHAEGIDFGNLWELFLSRLPEILTGDEEKFSELKDAVIFLETEYRQKQNMEFALDEIEATLGEIERWFDLRKRLEPEFEAIKNNLEQERSRDLSRIDRASREKREEIESRYSEAISSLETAIVGLNDEIESAKPKPGIGPNLIWGFLGKAWIKIKLLFVREENLAALARRRDALIEKIVEQSAKRKIEVGSSDQEKKNKIRELDQKLSEREIRERQNKIVEAEPNVGEMFSREFLAKVGSDLYEDQGLGEKMVLEFSVLSSLLRERNLKIAAGMERLFLKVAAAKVGKKAIEIISRDKFSRSSVDTFIRTGEVDLEPFSFEIADIVINEVLGTRGGVPKTVKGNNFAPSFLASDVWKEYLFSRAMKDGFSENVLDDEDNEEYEVGDIKAWMSEKEKNIKNKIVRSLKGKLLSGKVNAMAKKSFSAWQENLKSEFMDDLVIALLGFDEFLMTKMREIGQTLDDRSAAARVFNHLSVDQRDAILKEFRSSVLKKVAGGEIYGRLDKGIMVSEGPWAEMVTWYCRQSWEYSLEPKLNFLESD